MKSTLLFFLIIIFGCCIKTSAQTSTYNYIGAVQIYTVPPGVISLGIDVAGAQGGDYTTAPTASGGLGGRVQCNLDVIPGELLYIYVGQKGNAGCWPCGLVVPPPGGSNSDGGANGGAGSINEGGAAGGGSSDIRTIPYTSGAGISLSSRLVVGGAGGGGAWDCGNENGGPGGGLTGGTGLSCSIYNPGIAGTPGTQTSGGALGAITGLGSGTAGGFGYGGDAYFNFWGGGGGGGWFGAGGAYQGSGCGGSSYYGAAGVSSATTTSGFQSGNGYVQITVNCSAGLINGITSICTGTTTTLTDTTGSSSGTWSSSNTSVASVAATGIVTGVSAGTSIITYSVTIPCGSVYSITTVTINPLPSAIGGTTGICMGVPGTLTNGATGGTWASGNTSVATVISTTGAVTGAGLGTAAITYTLPTGCAAGTIVTVNSLSTPITGTASVCAGAFTTLSEATPGGTWSSSNSVIASAGPASGIITGGNVSGSASVTITYTAPGGCTISKIVTVNPQPAFISGSVSLCAGTTSPLFDLSLGGTWGSSNTMVASVSPTGIITGAVAGTSTITYTLAAGCSTTSILTVNPLPLAIAGNTGICPATTSTLTDATTGGFWTSSVSVIASVDPLSGLVTAGSFSGNTTISYSLGSGCAATAVVTVNVGPLPIIGTLSLCTGSLSYLSDDIGGGTWSSSNTSVATTDPLFGMTYGVSAGTATISYALGSCTTTAIVTVNPLPFLIIGPAVICVGQTTTLSDVATGGTWTEAGSAATIGFSTGLVSATAPGMTLITYTLPTGCATSKTMTVNTSPGSITGTARVCLGLTTTLSDAGGGNWASSNTAIATVGTTGVVGGISAGTTTITYSLGVGCSTTAIFTVNPLPSAIGGTATACAGSTTTLTNAGGTWSSSNTGIASVGPTGIVNGLTNGTATITFTLPTGCTSTRIVTINPLPPLIAGPLAVCPGATVNLSDLTTGGTWSSSSTIIATIGTTGVVSGAAPGVTVISYVAPVTGCTRTASVTVNPLPPAISGTPSMCAGAITILNDATTGGIWNTSGSIATVSPTGTVTGETAGTATISYMLGTGCTRTTTVTVNPLPTAITGPTAECVGATISETDGLPGGTWSSTTTGIAIIGPTGMVTGVTTGTTIITYTSAAGCKALTTISVSLSPTAITGPSSVCTNDTTTLSDAIGGGAWSSSNTAAATIGSLTGTVTGIAAGTTIITYSLGTGCTVTKALNINPAPLAITGGTSICIGSATTLSDGPSGGTWSSSATTIAPVSGTGVVTGAGAGTATVSYILTTTGCSSKTIVTVNPSPLAIAGTFQVCSGATAVLTDIVTGGTWTSSNTATASIDPTGTVTGRSPGTTTITYSLGAGCAVTKVITVNPISVITGSTGICVGAITTLSDATAGGTWSSPTGGGIITTGLTTGIVTGIAAGSALVTYTTTAGCSAYTTLNVNLAPSAISGTLHVCAGATTTLGNAASGGTWTSSTTSTATVTGAGVVSGSLPGTTTITYSLGGGCTTTASVTVNAAPVAITGALHICAGATITLNDATTGGVWSMASTTAATLSATGVLTGLSEGAATVSYTLPASGCAAIAAVTVNPLPGAITGTAHVCVGLTTTLGIVNTDGTWSSSNTSIAMADPLSGAITGVSPGPAVISYTLPTGCDASLPVIINAAPMPIEGNKSVCIGSATALSEPGGGVWTSSNTDIATVSATGIVSGTGLGTAMITYTLGGCPAITTVTINSLPGAITGAARICVGATITLSDLPAGGTWSSISAAIATADETSGIVTGVAAGITPIAYSMGAGCTVTVLVTVDPAPSPITGAAEVCLGYITTLGDASAGGTWSSNNTAVASVYGSGSVNGLTGGPATISYTNSAGCSATRLVTVVAVPPILEVGNLCAFGGEHRVYDSAAGGFWTSTLVSISTSGVITSYSSGVANITYTLPFGCYTTATLTINPLPGPIVGLNSLCMGSSTPLTDTTAGGTWSSSKTTLLPVDAIGYITGLSAGSATITYSLGTGCSATKIITVDTSPAAGTITGASEVCVGSAIVLSNSATGGTWSMSSIAATVFEGVVSGVSPGTDIISYTVSNSCGTVMTTKTVTVNALPYAGIINGASSVCAGADITLTDGATGGVWSAGNAVATIVAGVVSGMFPGIDTISYTVTNDCGTDYAIKTVTINTLPTMGPISGTDTICRGLAFDLLDTAAGGVWSSSNSHITISSSGIIIGASAGVDTITYSRTNSCGTVSASRTIAVKAGAVAGTITGNRYLCSGSKDTLTATPLGGNWTSVNTNAAISTTSASVIITGIAPGADTIIYTISNSCGDAVAILPITIYSIEQCDSIAGVAPVSQNTGELLHVWPNPNQGVFTVVLAANTDEPMRVAVTNIVGEKVKELITTTNKPAEIRLDGAAGIYFVTASTANGSYVAKVVLTQ